MGDERTRALEALKDLESVSGHVVRGVAAVDNMEFRSDAVEAGGVAWGYLSDPRPGVVLFLDELPTEKPLTRADVVEMESMEIRQRLKQAGELWRQIRRCSDSPYRAGLMREMSGLLMVEEDNG